MGRPAIWPTGFFRRAFGDFRTMWFDPDDPRRILIGSDGGVQISFDGGHTADYFPNIRVGEVVRGRRRHGRSLQRVRRLSGSRFVEGAGATAAGASSRWKTG